MLGFKQKTSANELKKWSKNLMINSDVLTTQCKYETKAVPSAKEERQMVREIRTRHKHEAKIKNAKLARRLKPKEPKFETMNINQAFGHVTELT